MLHPLLHIIHIVLHISHNIQQTILLNFPLMQILLLHKLSILQAVKLECICVELLNTRTAENFTQLI